MPRRISFKEVQQRIKDKYGENISIISDETKYKGTKYPLLFKTMIYLLSQVLLKILDKKLGYCK